MSRRVTLPSRVVLPILTLSLAALLAGSAAYSAANKPAPARPVAKPPAAAPAARPATPHPAAAAHKANNQNKTHVVTVHTDFQLEAGDNIPVRVLHPPAKFDEKGNIKKYSSAELKQLKGDRKDLPGYPVDYNSLKTGQAVLVYMSRVPTGMKLGETDAALSSEGLDGKAPVQKTAAKKSSRPHYAGILGGTLTTLEGSSRKFTLRVDTQNQVAGPAPAPAAAPAAQPGGQAKPKAAAAQKVDGKTQLKDFEIAMIVVVKE